MLEGEYINSFSYPNPTITEVVCDIHFQLPQSNPWKPFLPGEIFRLLQDEFPIMEPVLEMGLQFEMGPSGTSTKFLPLPQKIRFKHATRPFVFQIAENAFSINVLTPYPGWKVTRSYALEI